MQSCKCDMLLVYMYPVVDWPPGCKLPLAQCHLSSALALKETDRLNAGLFRRDNISSSPILNAVVTSVDATNLIASKCQPHGSINLI